MLRAAVRRPKSHSPRRAITMVVAQPAGLVVQHAPQAPSRSPTHRHTSQKTSVDNAVNGSKISTSGSGIWPGRIRGRAQRRGTARTSPAATAIHHFPGASGRRSMLPPQRESRLPQSRSFFSHHDVPSKKNRARTASAVTATGVAMTNADCSISHTKAAALATRLL
jgi:hypothetical protein